MTYNYTFNLGIIRDKDAKIKISGSEITLDRSDFGMRNTCSFNLEGMMTDLHNEGDLYPIGDNDDVLVDPELHIQVHGQAKALTYNFKGRGMPSMEISNKDVLTQILAQHCLAEIFYERLTSKKLSPEEESRGYRPREMLENVLNFDKNFYSGCTIKRER